MCIMILLLLWVGRMVGTFAVECDFDNIVVQDCQAVIIDPVNLALAKVIQNVELELACNSGVDCILISNDNEVIMINTTMICSGVEGAAGISLADGSLTMYDTHMLGCGPAIKVHNSTAVLQVIRSDFHHIQKSAGGRNGRTLKIVYLTLMFG